MRITRKLFFSYLQAPFLLVLYYLLLCFPLSLRRSFLSSLARFLGPYLPVTQKAQRNISLCYPDLPEDKKQLLIKNCWAHLGKIAAEFGSVSSLINQQNRFKIENAKNLQQALDTQKGIIFFSAHLGNWEICYADVLRHNIPIHLIARKQRNPVAEWLINRTRRAQKVTMIPRTSQGRKTLIKTLKGGGFIGALFDVYDSDGVFLPFFNRPAKTTTSLARMAQKLDFLLLPVQVIRQPDDTFIIRYHPPLHANKYDDEKKVMSDVNKHIESWIRENPAQWLWLHDRWKVKEKDQV